MSPTSRKLGLASLAVLLYAVVLSVVWASRPLEDSVPVGIDYTPAVAIPPSSPKLTSQVVECNTLFASAPRPDGPLPELTPQPEGFPELAYQREPCALVQADARRNLALNVVAVAGAFVLLGWLFRRSRRASSPAAAPGPDRASLPV
jgi:hypothetical protein